MATAKKTTARKKAPAKKGPGKHLFPKGESGNPKGRPKGVPNKVNTKFKEAVNLMLDRNAGKFDRWLNNIAEGNKSRRIKPDPKGALDIVHKLAEYCHPKLARTEMTGLNGKDLFEKMTDQDLDNRINALMLGATETPEPDKG